MTRAAAILEQGIAEIGIAVSDSQRDALLELGRLVEIWGARINLTGHRGLEAIIGRLVLDSVALAFHLPEFDSLADVGSGAGFPGLPIAILRPFCRVTLIEARERRHHFQRAACRALGLSNATPIRGRAEQLEAVPHAAVIAQAMARPDAALPILLPWAERGGLVIVPGGADPPVLEDPGIRTVRVLRYRAPCGGPERSLWIGQRLR